MDVLVWDLKKKIVLTTLSAHSEFVSCVSFSHENRHITSASINGEVLIFDVVKEKEVGVVVRLEERSSESDVLLRVDRNACDSGVNDLHYSPHFPDRIFITGERNGTVKVFDVRNGCQLLPIMSIRKHGSDHRRSPDCSFGPEECTAVRFSKQSPVLALSVGLDRRLVMYDIRSKKSIQLVFVRESGLTSLDCAADGTVFVGSANGELFQFDLRGGPDPVAELKVSSEEVRRIRFQHTKDSAKGVLMRPELLSARRQVSSPAKVESLQKPADETHVSAMGVSQVDVRSDDREVEEVECPGCGSILSLEQDPPISSKEKLRCFLCQRIVQFPAFSCPRCGTATCFHCPETDPQPLEVSREEIEDVVDATRPLSSSEPSSVPPSESEGGRGEEAQAVSEPAIDFPRQREPQFRLSQRETASSVDVGARLVALEGAVERMKESMHSSMQNLHIEVLRQFHLQQSEMAAMMSKLMERIESLATENSALKREAFRMKNLM